MYNAARGDARPPVAKYNASVLTVVALLVQAQLWPVQIAPEAIRASANQPQFAVGRDGTLWLAFGAKDTLYVCSSKDNGRSFSEPVAVNQPAGKSPFGMRRGPRIAAGDRRIVVTAIFGQQGGGRDGDLLAWRSGDGSDWDGPSKVSDEPGAAREGLHATGVAADGTFVAVWLDLRGKGTKLMGSYSSSGGHDWSKNKVVYESPEGTICECCHPSLGFGPFGEAGAMFRNSLRGARDMFLATSPDAGRSWDVARKLGSQTWEIAMCPMDGGALGFDSAGTPVSVWRSRDTVYLARGVASVEIAKGKNPWLATDGSTAHLVWQSGAGVYYQRGTDLTTRRQVAESGSDPTVAVTKGGAVVAWRQAGQTAGVYVARLGK